MNLAELSKRQRDLLQERVCCAPVISTLLRPHFIFTSLQTFVENREKQHRKKEQCATVYFRNENT